MKIAFPVMEKTIDSKMNDTLGRAPFFLLYNTNSEEIEYLDHRAVAEQGGSGVRAAQVLADYGVRAVITPHCGENAEKVFRSSEVLVYKAVSGSISRNIEEFKGERLNLMSNFISRKNEPLE